MKKDNFIFVFGSNLAGKHGKGAALFAKQHHGAIDGQGCGFMGRSYGIPTKDGRPGTPPLHRPGAVLPIEVIEVYVDIFKQEAATLYADNLFQVTRIGCGLAGYKDCQIAPLFQGSSSNVLFDLAWNEFLGNNVKYWGTHE